MPTVSMFYGLKVEFYPDDHLPPHFHAIYGDRKAVVRIDNGQVIAGSLPTNQLRMISCWAYMHQDELMGCWEAMRSGMSPGKIAPLTRGREMNG